MKQYMMLTRDPGQLTRIASQRYLENQVDYHFPEVEWLGNFVVAGPYTYLDMFEAPDDETAAKVALIARSVNGGKVEYWPLFDRAWFERKAASLGRPPAIRQLG